MRNLKFLQKAGIQAPMKVMDVIKNLPERGLFTFPDGTVVHQTDVVEPCRKGRKIVICGDTSDSRAIFGLAQGADVLIHEATNTFINGIDKDTNNEMVTINAKFHGHSTPCMAGKFAKRIRAKNLIMNHFSPRYKGDQSLESMLVMSHIELQVIYFVGGIFQLLNLIQLVLISPVMITYHILIGNEDKQAPSR